MSSLCDSSIHSLTLSIQLSEDGQAIEVGKKKGGRGWKPAQSTHTTLLKKDAGLGRMRSSLKAMSRDCKPLDREMADKRLRRVVYTTKPYKMKGRDNGSSKQQGSSGDTKGLLLKREEGGAKPHHGGEKHVTFSQEVETLSSGLKKVALKGTPKPSKKEEDLMDVN